MLRSFLSGSPALLARLCPIRHPCARSYSNGAAERRRRGGPNQRHLYVALEDSNGHALYKLNVDDLAGDDSEKDSGAATGKNELRRLPRPVLRLSYRSFGAAQFSALGSKIVITTGSICGDDRESSSRCLTLVYDTKTGKQDVQPFVPDRLPGNYSTVAAENKLYAFYNLRLPLYYLRDARAYPESDEDGTDESEPAADNDELEFDDSDEDDNYPYDDDSDEEEDVNVLREQVEERWTWKRSPLLIPCAADSESSVRKHTFYVSSGPVLHQDGRTIFLSTYDRHRPSKEIKGTFSLDTDQPSGGEWARLGNWELPFNNTAHYDRELDAWVGIHYSADTDCQHLCSCDLPATTGGNPTARPAWRLCKKELTFMEAPLNAWTRTLVHTGPGRFCLVEVAPFTRYSDRRGLDVNQDLLQVTMFLARHGKNGKLMVTPLRPGRSYLIPDYDPITVVQPPAFWM